jgi:hypothetical protein
LGVGGKNQNGRSKVAYIVTVRSLGACNVFVRPFCIYLPWPKIDGRSKAFVTPRNAMLPAYNVLLTTTGWDARQFSVDLNEVTILVTVFKTSRRDLCIVLL